MTLTKQQVFDRVWQHFVTDGNPRGADGEICFYRGTDGARCAVGLFMTDEEAAGVSNRLSASEVIRKGNCKALEGVHISFVTQMQAAHDRSGQHYGIESAFRKLAQENSLEVPS